MNDWVGGSRRGTSNLYAAIRYGVDQSLQAVSKRLKNMLDRIAKMLQQGVHDALRRVADGAQKSFVISLKL